MKKLIWICVLLLVFALVGCKNAPEISETKVVTPFATDTEVPTQTETPSPSATQTRSLTPTTTQSPSITPSPTATFTLTPTFVPQLSIAKSFANSYSGVASYAPLVAGFSQGMVINVLGISPDSNWLLIEIPPDQNAWIQKEDVEILNPEMDLLVVEVTPPPTPTPTSAAPPSISVNVEDSGYGNQDLFIQFFNFQPKEAVVFVIYDGPKEFKSSRAWIDSSGYGKHSMIRINIKKGVTYRIVADGTLGSHAEKSFSR